MEQNKESELRSMWPISQAVNYNFHWSQLGSNTGNRNSFLMGHSRPLFIYFHLFNKVDSKVMFNN